MTDTFAAKLRTGMRLLLLCLLLTSCAPALLTVDRNPYQLPLVHGVVSYQQTVAKKGIKFDEFYRAARGWFRENQQNYYLEWQPPVYPATLLHSAVIADSPILDNQSDRVVRRTVQYLITIDAKADSCRILLSNFEVSANGKTIVLERLSSDKTLCDLVNREGWAVVESLGRYIYKNSEKPL